MEQGCRAALVEASIELVRAGLNTGTAGNLSVRCDGGMLITPSGIPPSDLLPEMMASVDLASGDWSGPVKPSSEWRLHRDIFTSRRDIGAVVHTHSPYATILATQHRAIPAIHYMVAAFGGTRIECTPYAPFGTQALSNLILKSLGDRHGVLLGNHGMVATGADLTQAMWRAGELETLAKMYVIANATGSPVVLSDDEIERTLERFADYGLAAPRR